MILILFSFLFIISLNFACSKNDKIDLEKSKANPYEIYKEAIQSFERNDFFYANKKFKEAEINFKIVEHASKSAIMGCYSLYAINFYIEAESCLEDFLRRYPASEHAVYAKYLSTLVQFEQISDEDKDLGPLIKAKDKIEKFLIEYPNTDYAIDLQFKKDLIQNQLAAKEMYLARYYIKVKKWVPAINRLKKVVEEFDQTIFIEEALHRLVEINYHLGLEKDAKKYASILGYNYNSSEWYQKSFKTLNKNYKIKNIKKETKDSKILESILEKIKIF